jgi:general secretion pathway protein C
LPAQWLSKSTDVSSRLNESLEAALRQLSQPSTQRLIRRGVIALLVLWLLYSLVALFWSLVPARATAPEEGASIINPITPGSSGGPAHSVDLASMRDWHLFGERGADAAPTVPAPVAPTATEREGIEDGARETRLQLKLRGAVASSDDGLGHAIIEYRNEQAVYAVDDKLPVGDEVRLVKVMTRQVVLDNGGTYELLTLFEDSALDAQAVLAPPPRAPAPAAQLDKRSDEQATQLATGYRDRLYENPQSLAEVVSVNAVREDGRLMGYRITPGRDEAEFTQLGFLPGDLVTSVNGIALNDPANTMRLYQTLRTATEAVFELDRGGQQVSVAVSLGEQQQQVP